MELPKYSNSAKIGELGLTILKSIVEKELGWLLRPNHKENDFGIDAYIDVITEAGGVTGKCIAAQVKTGESYFSEENEIGWVYRDSNSHLNYYLNHDIPVVIILINEKLNKAYWCYCDPYKTEKAGDSWKIVVPKNSELNAKSKTLLLKYVSPVKDYVSQLENFWRVNEKLTSAPRIIISIDKEDVVKHDYKGLGAVIERLQVNSNLIKELKGKVDISIDGYTFDERELYEIPEVIEWCKNVFENVHGFIYFLPTDDKAHFLRLLQHVRVKNKITKDWEYDTKGKKTRRLVEFDLTTSEQFINDLYSDLYYFCELHNISLDVNKEITFNIAEYLTGEKIPDEIKNRK